MKFTKLVTAATLSLMLFAACNNEENGIGQPDIKQPATGTMTVYVSTSQSAGTRAVSQGEDQQGTQQESKVGQLEFYVFDQQGDMEKYIDIPASSAGASGEYTFAVNAGDAKTVLVAANMSLGDLGREDITKVRKALANHQITPLSVPQDGIPMAGEMDGVDVEEESIQRVNIEISRLYGRFNAPTDENARVNLESEELDKLTEIWEGRTIQGDLKFELNGYVVVNGLKTSFAFPNYGVTDEFAQWDENVWTIGANTANYTRSQYTDKELGNVYSGDSFLTDTPVYVFENSPHRAEEYELIGFAPETVYAFIIEAELYDNGNPQNTATRYWRINVSNTAEKATVYKILRNAIYNVDIRNVKTIGYATPEEAEKEKPIIPEPGQEGIQAYISVADWRVFNEGTDI